MRSTPFPADTVATVADLVASPWRQALPSEDSPGRARGIWNNLSQLSQKAVDEGRPAEAKILWLLADATSMQLKPESPNTPFAPMAQWDDGSRSAAPEDFLLDDLNLLADCVPHLDDAGLRARVADLVWVKRRAGSANLALAAIDAYTSLELTEDTWYCGAYDAWTRALVLCAQLGKASQAPMERLERELIAKFDADASKGFFLLKLSELLRRYLRSDDESGHVVDKLIACARARGAEGDHYAGRSYLDVALEWVKSRRDAGLAASLTSDIAESWAAEARANAAMGQNAIAATLIEKAVQTLRQIPSPYRAGLDVEQRLSSLRGELDRAGRASVSEMVSISTPAPDLSSVIEATINEISGKSTFEALKKLASIAPYARRQRILDSAERLLAGSIAQALFGVTRISSDGRTIGRRPALGLGGTESDEGKEAIYGAAVGHFQLHINIEVQAQIGPALQIFQREHRITLGDMVLMARGSSVVPDDRSMSIARGLYAGFDGDFLVATYVLIPQLEHLVRTHLKAGNAITTNLSKDGIEVEIGLTNLVALPQMTSVFGEDLTFTFDALFCHPDGANLRNETAHGLIDDAGTNTVAAVYAWWLMFKLVFSGFITAQGQWSSTEGVSEDSQPPSADSST